MENINQEEKTKGPRGFDEISLTFIVLILISTIFSINIGLTADIPGSVGHGGLVYVIYPVFFTFFIIIAYILLLLIRPKWKYISGMLAILINLGFGVAMIFIKF